MATAFDRALELNELQKAREAYASRHGDAGSVAYRAAWLRFHQRIQTLEDLQQLRRKRAGNRRQLKTPQPQPPAGKVVTLKVSQPRESMAGVGNFSDIDREIPHTEYSASTPTIPT